MGDPFAFQKHIKVLISELGSIVTSDSSDQSL